jgi:hypothetical protein
MRVRGSAVCVFDFSHPPYCRNQFSLVAMDWSHGKEVWANEHPMSSEQMLLQVPGGARRRVCRGSAGICPDVCPRVCIGNSVPSGCPNVGVCAAPGGAKGESRPP